MRSGHGCGACRYGLNLAPACRSIWLVVTYLILLAPAVRRVALQVTRLQGDYALHAGGIDQADLVFGEIYDRYDGSIYYTY